MLAEPRLVQHNLAIHFPRRPSIRREINVLEDALNAGCPGGYGTPQVVAIPDEVGPEIPRVIFSAVSGFSMITVSQQVISLAVNYSPDWQVDREKCLSYLKRRAHVLFTMLDRLEATSSYVGVATLLRVSSPQNDANEVLEPLKKLFSPSMPLADSNEISVRISKSINRSYFANATISSTMEWPIANVASGRFPLGEHISANIDIAGDFNNRLAFNENSEATVSLEGAVDMIDKAVVEVYGLMDLVKGVANA